MEMIFEIYSFSEMDITIMSIVISLSGVGSVQKLKEILLNVFMVFINDVGKLASPNHFFKHPHPNL